MNPAGHLAVSAFVSSKRRRLAPVLVGMFLPDLIDKPLTWAGVTPYGRTVGHSLVFWLTAALLVALAYVMRHPREETLLALLAGGWAHLATDLVDDVFCGFEAGGYAFSAWAGWPWTNPDMWAWRVPHLLSSDSQATSLLELAALLAATALLVRARAQ